MIKKVNDKRQLNNFVYFVRQLYKDQKDYGYPIFSSLKKELTTILLQKKTYTALLCYQNDKPVGRLMYTVDASKQKGQQIGYFSYFDCVNDIQVAKQLFDYAQNDLKSQNITHLEGTFCPYDPDTRRGILVEGFDQPHTIFTSYNYPYYATLLEELGFTKAYDTFTTTAPMTQQNYQLLKNIAQRSNCNNNLKVDDLNKKHLQQDIDDVASIFKQSTTEINYQQAPTKEQIAGFIKSTSGFLDAKLVKILRTTDTNQAVGFAVVLPDYNQILSKTKGKLNLFYFLTHRKKLKRARGILQYIIPQYQKTGALFLIYAAIFDALKKRGVIYFEGGTIMENNTDSWGLYSKLGGGVAKIHRIYSKEL